MSTTPIAIPPAPAVPQHSSTLFTILQFVMGLMPSVVQGLQAATVPNATKKDIAVGILGAAFNGMSTAHQILPSNNTLSLVNQLTDIGIETAVSVLKNPPSATPLQTSSAMPAPATDTPAQAS